MTSPITLYDIPSQLYNNAWSPNVWKARYALNIKDVPYKTEWVEYQDIEALAEKLGASPTRTKSDGTPMYTLPIISDPNTGKVLSDSFLIAEYLDATYPEGNTLFPRGSKPLIAAFESAIMAALGAIIPAQFAITYAIINPASKEHFRRTKEARVGRKLEEFSPVGPKRDSDLAKFKGALAAVDGWLSKSDGKFVLGNTISFADCVLAGLLGWIKITNGIWDEVATWHNGRWATYFENMENAGYTSIH